MARFLPRPGRRRCGPGRGPAALVTGNEFVAPYLFEVREEGGKIRAGEGARDHPRRRPHGASAYRQAGGPVPCVTPMLEARPQPNMYRYDEFDAQFVAERVEQFRGQVARRLSGELTEDQFKPLRLMNGLYLQLHAYMLRIAVPYGTLSSRQMRKLAHIARNYDKGFGHFTTRTNLQLNWIKLVDVPEILRELASVEMHCIQTIAAIACAMSPPTSSPAPPPEEIEDPQAAGRDHPPMVEPASGIRLPGAQIQDRGGRHRDMTAPRCNGTTWRCRS